MIRGALRFIGRVIQPSLMRRLVLAQMAVVAALWTLIVGLLFYDSYKDPELLRFGKIYESVAAIAINLADDPKRQYDTLHAFDLALMETASDGNAESDTSPMLQVWQRGKLIYRTTDSVPEIVNSAPDVIETVHAGGREWRARTLHSPQLDTRVMIAEPGIWRLVVNITYRGYYLLPLLVSLPFLVVPAWLTVRLALRPWRRVSRETSERGPADLTPLSYRPPHRELQPLVQSINTLLQRVRDSTTRERSLIADAAHELRTPLAAMRAEIEALQDGVRTFDERTALRLHRQVIRLGQLVDDLRSSMRAPQSDLPTTTVYPLSLLKEALDHTRDRFAQRGIAVDRRAIDLIAARKQPAIEGDAHRLHQVFMNLLENTLAYTDPGGVLRIDVTVEGPWTGHSLTLLFDDSAPGVPESELPRLFDRLFRGETSRSREHGGSGLGLSICRTTIEAHGGTIDASPSPMGGLRVTLTLPLATSP